MLVLSLLTRSTFIGILSSSFSSTSMMSPSWMDISTRPYTPSPPTTDPKMMQIKSRLVRKKISSLLKNDPTLAGPLLRLAFHDAGTRENFDNVPSNNTPGTDTSTKKEQGTFTGGANGSVQYELSWSENRALSRPLRVVQKVYKQVQPSRKVQSEWAMSLADMIALAGAQAVEVAGGPTIPIHLGRSDVDADDDTNQKEAQNKDEVTRIITKGGADPYNRRQILESSTKRSIVTTTLPSAGLDSDGLRLYFGALGLTESELVAICGAHDLGRHVTLLNMTKSCLKNLTRDCLENAPVSVPFVSKNPDSFSNDYYNMLLKWNERNITLGDVAFIPTDVDLVVDEGLRKYVVEFAKDEDLFFSEFRVAYQKIVDASATSFRTY